MGQRGIDAAVKDALIQLSKEECAGGMGQSSNYAAVKDVQIQLGIVECVKGMEQRRRLAAVKVARIKLLRKEEYVKVIGQKGHEYSKEVCATSVLSHAAGGSHHI